jgi:phosphoglycolate phosphatase
VIQAVVFDLDGTLVDSAGDIAAAMNSTLAARGMPEHDVATYRRLVGEGVEALARRAIPPERAAEVEAVVAQFRARYARGLLDSTRPYPGVPQMLASLLGHPVRLGVLSNKPDLSTQKIVGALFPGTFHAVSGERPGVPRKPDPRGLFELAGALGGRPQTTALVGDSGIDMQTARAAGMAAVGVTWGFRDEAELRANGADVVIHHPSELAGKLELPPP